MISAKTSKMLRGIAILIVIASHYAGWMYVEPKFVTAHDWILKWGPEGVSIFLLMSGYGLHKSAERGRHTKRNDSGITAAFVGKRVIGAYIPYLLCRYLINVFDGTWKSAASEGTMQETLVRFFTAEGFWYMNVLFTMYIAFMVIYRFSDRLRIPLIALAVIGQTYYLYSKGYADFWELSNMAFIVGILAAAAEDKFRDFMLKPVFRILLALISGAGMWYTFMQVQAHGGSRTEGAFAWELAFNIFFSLGVLFIGYIIPTYKGLILTTLGECSLFIYILHTAMFWVLIYKFEEYGYAVSNIITGLITLVVGTVLGVLYNNLIGMFTRRKVNND